MNNTNNIVERALVKALELHKDQVRKGDRELPYIVHPIGVGLIVARYTNTKELIAAAILHDTVEDCEYTPEAVEKEFGPIVKDFVAALSEDKSIKDWTDRKNENLKRLRANQDAYFVKSADALANMRSLVSAVEKYGPAIWGQFHGTREQQMNHYRVILQDTESFLPPKLLEDYVAAMKDLEYSDFLSPKAAFGFAA